MSTRTAYVSPTERVKVWREGPALNIRFNNPARHNALSLDMWEAVPVILGQAETDESVRLVVFSGEGEKAFVSGADISQFDDLRAAKEAVTRYEASAEACLEGIAAFSKPTIAAIRGYCFGGGVNVAVACDIRIASATALFCIPATRLGLGYRVSALRNLLWLIGPGNTMDIFLTARRFKADEALRMGLVNRVTDDGQLDAVVAEYVTAIGEGAPLTMKAAKRAIRELSAAHPGVDEATCRQMILDCFQSEDYAEGRAAFKDKRKPAFRGR